MRPDADTTPQLQFLLPDLATMLDARQPLHQLARRIDWAQFETAFARLPTGLLDDWLRARISQ